MNSGKHSFFLLCLFFVTSQQYSSGDVVVHLLQVLKPHVDWVQKTFIMLPVHMKGGTGSIFHDMTNKSSLSLYPSTLS